MAIAASRPISFSAAAPADDGARPRKRASEPPIAPGSPMIVLAYRCLRSDYDSLVKRQTQRVSPPTPEDVHQTRIAARRLRVGLEVFGPLLPREASRHLRRELRWFARALGTVRDIDVHADALRKHLQSAGERAAREIGGFELALRRDRTTAHEKLRDVFASARYAALMTSLFELLDGAPTPAALRRWRSFTVSAGAAHYLKRVRRRVVKRGRKLDAASPADDLHRVRIRAKHLRYALEFFLEPYPELEDAAAAAKALQDVLGEHHDALTERRRVLGYKRALRKRHGSDMATPDALGEWSSAQHRRAKQARLDFAAEWPRFLAATRLSALGKKR